MKNVICLVVVTLAIAACGGEKSGSSTKEVGSSTKESSTIGYVQETSSINDGISDAQYIRLVKENMVINGNLDENSDKYDYYKVWAAAGILNFELTGNAGTDFDLDLYDENRDTVDYAWGTNSTESMKRLILPPDNFFIRVSTYAGAGDYNLTISDTQLSKESVESSLTELLEPDIFNDDLSERLPSLPADISISGSLSNSDKRDHYAINAAGNLKIALEGPGSFDVDITLYDAEFNQIAATHQLASLDYIIENNLPAARYYILLDTISTILPEEGSHLGRYELNITTPCNLSAESKRECEKAAE